MDKILIQMVEEEERRGILKWSKADKEPGDLLNAATEELGEVAHAINHNEGVENAAQEIAETIGVLSRLYNMLWGRQSRPSKLTQRSEAERQERR